MSEHKTEQHQEEAPLTRHYESGSHWIVTANHGFIPYAQEELRRRYSQLKSKIFVPGEVALMELPITEEEQWRHQQDQPAIFIRDMFPVSAVVPVAELETVEQAVELLKQVMNRNEVQLIPGTMVAIHLRKSQAKHEPDTDLRPVLEETLKELELVKTVQQPEWIWDVFVHQGYVYTGLALLKHQGSDWPGGAIRFQREEGQISRAKFKLLEAEKVFGLDLASYHRALDIGAAPGGWTSLLLERGLQVTAVDPAKMHDSLIDHPSLEIHQRNAGEVAFEPDEFDLLVCDMSWSPKHTAHLVIQLLDAVRTGGTIIVTVKLMHKKPLQTIRNCMDMYEQHLHIVQAKQLFHNRDEITLYMMKY